MQREVEGAMAKNEQAVPDRRVAARLESLKHLLPSQKEYWFARDLQAVLGYADWRNLLDVVIARARDSCEQAGNNPRHHFGDITRDIPLPNGTSRGLPDVVLTRYAAYLVAMNGDPKKPEIAAAQAYFAVQTRRQEISDQQDEAEKRIALRDRVRKANTHLAGAAKQAGLQRYGIFQDYGYRGLYGGLGLKDIKQIKGLAQREDLLDRAGRAELAANEFRITQTEQALHRNQVKNEQQAFDTHHRVGQEVRATIERTGGTMPEQLPPEQSIKSLKTRKKKAALPPPTP